MSENHNHQHHVQNTLSEGGGCTRNPCQQIAPLFPCVAALHGRRAASAQRVQSGTTSRGGSFRRRRTGAKTFQGRSRLEGGFVGGGTDAGEPSGLLLRR